MKNMLIDWWDSDSDVFDEFNVINEDMVSVALLLITIGCVL